MSSGFVPLAGPALPSPPRGQRAARARARAAARPPADAQALPWCVLAVTLLLELALALWPQALLLAGWQATHAFRLASGYALLALLAFSAGFGWLRRRPGMARRHRRLNEVHQLAGLCLLVLLALHAAARPAGFLLPVFHAVAAGLAAGALRAALGRRLGRTGGTALLTVHVALAGLVCAAALLHVWFVYTYAG